MRSLKEQVKDLELGKANDYDPEDDVFAHKDDESSIESDSNELNGREHYEEVGKSSLRKPFRPRLGKKYEGVVVSRDALNDEKELDPFAPVAKEDDDDPFAVRAGSDEQYQTSDGGDGVSEDPDVGDLQADGEIDEDDEIDSDEAFGDEDEETFKDFQFLGSHKQIKSLKLDKSVEDKNEAGFQDVEDDIMDDKFSGEDDDSGAESDEDSDIMKDDDFIDSDLSSFSSGDSSEVITRLTADEAKFRATIPNRPGATDREKLKAIVSNDSALVAASLSDAASADVKKGAAVKQQRQIYDRLLDARIKLQKGLKASNELSAETVIDAAATEEIRKAEEAALTLWSTIDSIRCELANSQLPGSSAKKRKFPLDPTPSTPTTKIWEHAQSLEMLALPTRRKVLDKWRASTTTNFSSSTSSRLQSASSDQTKLSAVLDTYLATESVKLPSLTPSGRLTYDDSLFYQSLLRDLIASRSSNPNSNSLPPSIPQKFKATTKSKNVDTKASKGRKVRYTPHEKLMNFMAGEDRRTWGERASREFFGSLFGRRVLDEDDGGDEGENSGGGEGEEALRLFRR